MKAELNLDNAPSATHRPSAPTVRPPARRRSPVPVVLAVAALAALAVAGLRLLPSHGDGGRRSAPSEWIDLSNVTEEMRPVVDYLSPSPDEAALWFHSIRTSTYVRQKWAALADAVQFVYAPSDDEINAFACFKDRDPEKPMMVLQGGLVRLSRLLGAASLLRASAEAQGVEKNPAEYVLRILQETGGGASLSQSNVVALLNEFDVGTAVFQDVAAVSEAKSLANGICKAVLGHEMGHLAGGHPLGADPNMTVSKNEESQADLFASSLAASMENGPYMLKGQIAFWHFLALGEKQNPTNELFRTHPYSAERLCAAVRANKALAASIGITPEIADNIAASAAQIAAAVVRDDPDGGDGGEYKAVCGVLEGAGKSENGGLSSIAPEGSREVSVEEIPEVKSAVGSSGFYTEFGAILRLAIESRPNFVPRTPAALIRISLRNGGLVKETVGEGFSVYAAAGAVSIGGNRYRVFENPQGSERMFVSSGGELLAVQNAVLAATVVLYDKGDTRRSRSVSGFGRGVSFPWVDQVVQWSLSQPLRVDPAALASIDFGGGRGSPDCPVCRGLGYVKKPGPASYGQSHGDNWILVPCTAPSCRAGR